jgi:hypothetical protein
MTNTTKILAGLLVAALLLGLGGDQIHDWFYGELIERQRTLKKLSQQVNEKQLELRRAKLTCDTFNANLAKSLSADPANAQVTYQEYLIHASESCQLADVLVSSSQPEPVEGLGSILHFSIQGSGETEKIGKFIDAFYRTEALHRLSHLNIYQALGPDAPTHSFSLDVEVLILSEANANASSVAIEIPKSFKLENLFASRDIFRRPQIRETPAPQATSDALSDLLSQLTKSTKPEKQPPPQELTRVVTPPPPDPKGLVRLVGVIENGDNRSAIFFDSLSGQHQTLTESTSLTKLGIDSQIIEIRRSTVVLQDANTLLELGLGELFKEAGEVF